jgi:hypothetical protein
LDFTAPPIRSPVIAGNYELNPEQFLHFVELDEFRGDWELLGLDVENDLLALQVQLMWNPAEGDVIAGAGGLRKLRFAPPSQSAGKRGSVRVCYCWWPRHWLILLVIAYGKSRKSDLNAAERNGIRRYLERTEQWLENRRKQRRT